MVSLSPHRLSFKLLILALFIFPKTACAIDSPSLNSPSNNSNISTSKLEWHIPSFDLYSNKPFRIQVDEQESFDDPFRDYSTNNNHYTPTLTEGTWYWRIKVKDSNETWSDWSSVWKFTYSTTATPIPTSTPTSTRTPTSTPTNTNIFQISNIPSKINSDQSFKIKVEITLPSNPNEELYLKGAFKKSDSSNYFGLTKINSDWIKNGESYNKQFHLILNAQGKWTGEVEVKPDIEDSGYTGSGNYIFKLAYYKSNGSGPNWSNELSLEINNILPPQNSSAPTSTPTPIPSVSPTSLKSSTHSAFLEDSSSDQIERQIATIAGLSTSSVLEEEPQIEVKAKQRFNMVPIVGIAFMFAGICIFSYLYFKKRLGDSSPV